MRYIGEEPVARSFAEPEVGWSHMAGPAGVGQEEILCKAKYHYVPFLGSTGLAGQENGIRWQVAQHALTMRR